MKLISFIYSRIKTERLILFIFSVSLFSTGCKKFVTVDPPLNSLPGATIFSDDGTALAAVTGIYVRLIGTTTGLASGNQSIGLLTGAAADEQQVYSAQTNLVEFGQNNLRSRNDFIVKLWNDAYTQIYSANAIIDGAANSTNISAEVKKQITGEAKFMRAFLYFYLVNLYGAVPYVTSTDYLETEKAARTPVIEVYSKVIEDLTEAQNLLSSSYSISGNERSRPTKMAATALLARIYLYTGNWSKAESLASDIISNTALFKLPVLSQVFLKNSNEAIWQLQPVLPGLSTIDGFTYIFTSRPTRTALTTSFINSFETNDSRKTAWVGSKLSNGVTYYHPNKYKERTIPAGTAPNEYLMVLRLAEQYLIRAEARAMLDNITGARSDINAIRTRAGLPGTTATDKASVLDAIEKERRIELFSEWGHRWLDLKRTSRIDAVLSAFKGANWQSTDQLFPLPQGDLDRNPNLRPQNPGY